MAICPKCGAQVPDGTQFCTVCGTPLAPAPMPQQGQFMAPPPQQYQTAPQQYRAASASKSDHTAEYAKDDIKKHKGIAAAFYAIIMLMYFITIDGIGLTSFFTTLVDRCVDMFTNGRFANGNASHIEIFAFMGLFILAAVVVFKESPYVRFHGRMAFKLLALAFLTYFLNIIPVAGPVICLILSWVVIGIAFISLIFVLMGKVREPIIVEYIF